MTQRKPAPVTRLHASTKLFVLDTNVLMHDPTSLFRFEEHDIYLPMATLEELDANKKGMSEVARNARQASRFLDELARPSAGTTSTRAFALGRARRQGRRPAACSCRPRRSTASCRRSSPPARPTTRSSAWCAICRRASRKRQVILVSKDINMRIKARALGLAAEDYFNDKVLEDTDLLYTGVRELPADFWDTHGKEMESWQQAGRTFYRVHGPLCASLLVNEFVYQEAERPFYAQVKELSRQDRDPADPGRLHAPAQQRLGHRGAQPRAELRAQPADESGDRLRHPARPGRHRQDAAHARRRA